MRKVSHRRIADMLDIAPKTARDRIARAERKLIRATRHTDPSGNLHPTSA